MNLLDSYGLNVSLQSEKIKNQRQNLQNPLNISSLDVKKIKRTLYTDFSKKFLTFQDEQNSKDYEIEIEEKQKDVNQVQNPEVKTKGQVFLNFCIIQKSADKSYDILIEFKINLKTYKIVLTSTLLNNFKIVKIQGKQTIKYLSTYILALNSRIKEGSFSILPNNGSLKFIVQMLMTQDKISSFMRKPQKFKVLIMEKIAQTLARWKEYLDKFLIIGNRKNLDSIFKNPITTNSYKISKYVIHSHIQPMFFENPSIIRFNKKEEYDRNRAIKINKKKLQQMKTQYLRTFLEIVQNDKKHLVCIYPIKKTLKTFLGQKTLKKAIFSFPKWDQIDKNTFAQANDLQKKQIMESKQESDLLSRKLFCRQYTAKSCLYSSIQIDKVLNRINIFKTGFSQINVLNVICKREGDKELTRAQIIEKTTQQKRLQNQIQILKMLQKQRFLFIPRYFYCEQPEFQGKILIENIPQCSIDKYQYKKGPYISLLTKLFLLYQIVISLRFLRDFSVVHVDLKPQNVLLKIVQDPLKQCHYLVKLIDFGESYCQPLRDLLKMQLNRQTYPGFTFPYSPPELMQRSNLLNQKIDVFSFGIIFYETLFDYFPPELINMGRIKQAFIRGQYFKILSMQPENLENFGLKFVMKPLYYLCLKCLDLQQNNRPTLDWLCIILKETIDFITSVANF